MSLVYTKNPQLLKATIFAVVILWTCSLFFGLQPRYRTMLPGYQPWMLHNFIQDIHAEGLQPQEYWEFREFYSPGSFEFDDNVIQLGETQRILELPNKQTSLLRFNSPKLKSTDFLVQYDPYIDLHAQMSDLIAEYHSNTAIFQDNQTIVMQLKNGKWLIIFARTIEEMQTANGFFDYTPKDLTAIENTFWLNITEVTP